MPLSRLLSRGSWSAMSCGTGAQATEEDDARARCLCERDALRDAVKAAAVQAGCCGLVLWAVPVPQPAAASSTCSTCMHAGCAHVAHSAHPHSDKSRVDFDVGDLAQQRSRELGVAICPRVVGDERVALQAHDPGQRPASAGVASLASWTVGAADRSRARHHRLTMATLGTFESTRSTWPTA